MYLHSILKGYHLNKVEFENSRRKELENKSLDELTDIFKKLNPQPHNTTDLLIKERVIRAIMVTEQPANEEKNRQKIKSLTIGIKKSREEIKESITVRLKKRLNEGMIEEVKKLVNIGVTYEKLSFFGLEYKYIGQYLQGKLTYNDMFQKLNSAIHNFAKRQMTWFRKMERERIEINWIEGGDIKTAEKIIRDRFLISSQK